MKEIILEPKKKSSIPIEAEIISPDKIIQKNLKEIIPIGEGENLELWYTAVEIRGGQEVPSGRMEEAIHNVKAVFTRVVDGIPVVGNGSKVVVLLSATGRLVGFDIDWSPIKRSGEVKKVASVTEVLTRMENLKQILNREQETAYRDDFMECGYYDIGARYDSIEKIEPGCVVYRSPVGEGIGQLIAIPAAEKIPRDVSWREAVMLKDIAK